MSGLGVIGRPKKDEPLIRLGETDIYIRHRFIVPLQCIAAGWSWTEVGAYVGTSEQSIHASVGRIHPFFKDLRRSNLQRFVLEHGITPIQDTPPPIPRQGLIYTLSFSYCDDLVKIGKSTIERLNPRLSAYKTAHCQHSCSARLLSIELVHHTKAKHYERSLHHQFKPLLAYQNSEWYFNQGAVSHYISQNNPETLFRIHQKLSPSIQEFFQPCLF